MKKERDKLSHWQLSSFFARIRYGNLDSKLMNLASLYWIFFMGNKDDQARKHISSIRGGIPIVAGAFQSDLMNLFGERPFIQMNVIRIKEGVTISMAPKKYKREEVLDTLRAALYIAEGLEEGWFKKEEETPDGSSN